jgi:hypothetical protein
LTVYSILRREMTVTLNLPPDVERAFLAEAQVRGVSPDECIRELLIARAASGADAVFEPLWDKLAAIESAVSHSDWKGESDAPNARSLVIASEILARLKEVAFYPSGIIPSAEGGIGIYFEQDRKYADIEVLNSGKLLGVTSDRSGTIIPFEVPSSSEGYGQAITRVRGFFAA